MEARRARCWFAVLAAATVTLAPLSARAASATSASQQFTAHASDSLLPSAVCVLAEQLKRAWLGRLDLADRWRDPIGLVIRERAASETDQPAIRVEVFKTDVHL